MYVLFYKLICTNKVFCEGHYQVLEKSNSSWLYRLTQMLTFAKLVSLFTA